MKLLDGKLVSETRLLALKKRISEAGNKGVSLHVVRVGEDPASKIYVGRKIKACEKVGIESKEWHFPSEVSETELLTKIESLNRDSKVHAILLQLPLPKHLNSSKLIEAISPRKDVDGFHPFNLGKLVAREEAVVACTPLGIMHLLEHYKIPIEGKRAVVIGRSRIVGRPLSLLLDQAGATVSVVHLQTPNPEALCREADILVAACGVPRLVKSSYVKEGAVVVDVGIHREDSGKICGDVDFESVAPKTQWITPVPGSVGPMTICSLLENAWSLSH